MVSDSGRERTDASEATPAGLDPQGTVCAVQHGRIGRSHATDDSPAVTDFSNDPWNKGVAAWATWLAGDRK